MVDFDNLREIYLKCITDKSRIFMIKQFLTTYNEMEGKDVPFNLFPRQEDLCVALGNAKNVATTKPRQAGITTTTAAWVACEMALADPESPQTALCIGNSLDLSQNMLFKVRDFLLQFPLWIWGDDYMNLGQDPMLRPKNKNLIFDVCNSKELRLKTGSRFVARSSGPDASRGVGGVSLLIFDEAAFIENGKDVYASAIPTVSTGGHVIMISTPNGKDMLYYETCRRAKLKGTSDWNGFELVELKWYEDPRYNRYLKWTKKNSETGKIEVIEEECIDDKGNIRYEPDKWAEYANNGWHPTSPWYISMCRAFNNDRQKIAQELDVSFLGSAANVVEPEFIEMQTKLNQREPLYADPLEDNTWIWKEPIEGHHYIMAIDNSRGDSADRTALEIIDMDGVDESGTTILEQVLEYNGKKTGDVVGEMAFQYGNAYNNAFIVVEDIGGQGDATILALRNLGYTNVYYDDPDMKTYMIEREACNLPTDAQGRLPGFHTNSVRYQMLSSFANMVRTNQFKIRSKRVISELDTWIYKGKEGRMDHQDGCHDDTITCLAMGLWVMNTSLKKQEANTAKAKMMLKAFISANSHTPYDNRQTNGNVISIESKKEYPMPFYTNNSFKSQQDRLAPYRWVIA